MEYTIIGKIINTHGLHGEVKVFPLTNDIERFNILKKAFIGEDKKEVNISGVKYHKGIAILKFKEFNDINEILKLKDNYIYVDKDNRVVLPDNEFFIYDLVDCKVFDLENNYIGVVRDIIQGASNDVYVIINEDTSKEYLIPAVKQFIKTVDIKNKLITIDPIEGMIEWRLIF